MTDNLRNTVKYFDAPKKFEQTQVTLKVVDETGQTLDVTKSVKEWCTERKLIPHRVYMRRKKFTTWEESLSTENLFQKNKLRHNATTAAIFQRRTKSAGLPPQ